MKRLDRLQAILIILQSRSLVRGRELAERFGLSLRTVYRDMLALGEAGVPIRSEAGMGYSLERGYSLPPVSLDGEEAGALVAAGKLVEAGAGPFLGSRYASALEKIRAALADERKAYAETLEARMLSTSASGASAPASGAPSRPGAPGGDQGRAAIFEAAQRALGEGRVARIRYRPEAGGEAELRDVEPLALAFEGGSWRMVAYCRLRKGFRLFLAEGILSCEPLVERFEPGAYELPVNLGGERFAGSRFTRVVLKFAAEARVEGLESAAFFGFIGERRTGQKRELEFLLDSPLHLAPYLLAYGSAVEVLEPPELAVEMLRRSEELFRHYSRG